MKKLAILLLAAVLTVTLACAVAATAAEEPLYAAAADGDLLYTVDFRGDDRFSPQRSVNESPEEIEITPYADGSGVYLKAAAGVGENEKYWGGIISGLTADGTTNYTMTYKIRMNGKNGKNNAIGIGGLAWNLESTEKSGVRFLNNYGSYKSQFPDGEEVKQRTGLSVDDCRISDYVYDIANAIEDADGFITCRIDFNGPSDNYTAYCLTGTGWTYIEDQSMFEPVPDFAEVYSDAKYVALYIYTYWDVIDVDVKDVKWFKGVNLTDDQLGGKAEAAAPGFATAEDAIASIGKTAITGVTANGGTDHFGDESPDNLWDGNTATKFCTNSLPAIAYMTLDGMYSFDGVAIATANDNAAYGRIPTSWTLSGSNDGENWEVFYTGDDSMFEKVDFTYFATAFDASASYSQVKFEIASSTDDVVQVSEVVLTGTRTGDLPADEPAAPTYTYPASGESGNFLSGTVIGNATGWDGTEGSGASAAFDGNPASYFDPPSKGGDNWCGMDFGKKIVLEKVVILSRENWNARFNGATIDGSNDGVNWTTLYQASGEGTNPDYYVITEFENNTGYSMYRYHNEVEHGDVAEVEFYGTDAPAEEVPTSSPVDEELEAKAEAPNTFDFGVIAAVAAVISLAGFAAAKKKH